MTKYELCSWLRREFRQIHPCDLQRATNLMVRLSSQCIPPPRFIELFTAAGFDKTPVAPRIDPELWPERPVDADWSQADEEYSMSFESPETQTASPEELSQCL